MKKEKRSKKSKTIVTPICNDCPKCGKKFRYESERKRHELSHTAQFQCKACLKSFSFLSALKRHELQHTRKEKATCSVCNKKFLDGSLLLRHINYAHKGTIHCEKCSAKFNSETALKTHLLIHSKKEQRKYKCNFEGCNKSFNFVHHLKHHELTHKNEKQYFCNVCGKGFIQSHHMKSHMLSHEPESLLPCPKPGCDKKFATEYTRKRHLATHDELCFSCGKSLSSKLLDKHLKKCLNSEMDTIQALNIERKSKIKNQARTTSKNRNEIEPEDCGKTNSNVMEESNNEKTEVDQLCEDDGKATYCHSAIGGCLVSNGKDDCICVQINDSIDKSNNLDVTSPKETNLQPVIESVRDNESCAKCACGSKLIDDDKPFKPTCKDSMPSLEYRADGVIKLVDTYDINIVRINNVNDQTKFVPANSCKAILGNCIVTGDDSIGEGCLCAKMSLDSHNSDEDIGVFDS